MCYIGTVSLLGGGIGGLTHILENFPSIFSKAGEILHKEIRKKINKCYQFSLFNNPQFCFSNPRKDTVSKGSTQPYTNAAQVNSALLTFSKT
jgi:hypothetical protein